MTTTWYSDTPPTPPEKRSMRDWLRVIRRGVALVVVLVLGVILHSLVRLVEALIHGAARPWSGPVVQGVCILSLLCLGIKHRVSGKPSKRPGAVVANHVSWLDIFVLNAALPICFVSKDAVKGWPGIGLLARITGTLFISRDRRDTKIQQAQIAERIDAGQRLLFFPEGTTSDGLRVLPFKPTLFAPFVTAGLPVQPISTLYHAPQGGADPRVYGWWGDTEFGAHLLQVLALKPQGRVEVVFHPVIESADRKELARKAEKAVRAGLV